MSDKLRKFDAKMRPLSSYEAMETRIKFLERQIDRLARALKASKMRDGPPDIIREERPTLN